MLRVRSPSLLTSSSPANASRARCLAVVPSRFATLLLALLGLVAHLQTFKHLAVLYETYPNVPSRVRVGVSPHASPLSIAVASADSVDAALPLTSSHGDSTAATARIVDAVLATTASLAPTPLSPSSIRPTSTASPSTTSMSSEEMLALVRPTRWFNLLPARPWSGDRAATPEEAAAWHAQQADQDGERKSWEAARVLTRIMRYYAFASAVASLFGIYGAARMNLSATRIFTISSFLDVSLFGLSVLSFCVLITNGQIRALICEQISSGELHALLSYIHGAHDAPVTPSSLLVNLSEATGAPIPTGTSAAGHASGDVLANASILTQAASSLWKRAVGDGSLGKGVSAHTYWWDVVIDNMLENESCDDIFLSVLVPTGLTICVAYLALRVHFLFVIRAFYTTLLRQQRGLCLESSPSSLHIEEGRLPVSEKDRKYSSSSSSSSTVIEPPIHQAGKSKSSLLSSKALNEKLA